MPPIASQCRHPYELINGGLRRSVVTRNTTFYRRSVCPMVPSSSQPTRHRERGEPPLRATFSSIRQQRTIDHYYKSSESHANMFCRVTRSRCSKRTTTVICQRAKSTHKIAAFTDGWQQRRSICRFCFIHDRAEGAIIHIKCATRRSNLMAAPVMCSLPPVRY